MRLTILPEIFAAFPGLRVVAARLPSVDNRAPRPDLDRAWSEVWDAAARSADAHANPQSHPRIAPWRASFQRLGFSGKKFPSSIEAVLRRAWKGGEPFRINPLVDFYNAVSLAHVVPAGGFDVRGVDEVVLRLTRGGDTFRALDDDAVVAVPPGEVGYVVGSTVLTRHFVWRQSREHLIRPESDDVLVLAEILGELPIHVSEEVATAFADGAAHHFDVEPSVHLLDASKPSAAW